MKNIFCGILLYCGLICVYAQLEPLEEAMVGEDPFRFVGLLYADCQDSLSEETCMRQATATLVAHPRVLVTAASIMFDDAGNRVVYSLYWFKGSPGDAALAQGRTRVPVRRVLVDDGYVESVKLRGRLDKRSLYADLLVMEAYEDMGQPAPYWDNGAPVL
ncbi:MAG TPA: hypothetical protein PLV25_04635, partial [Opitutales bacterium]|nr:hypothetical protein [Opitutales bacterium]